MDAIKFLTGCEEIIELEPPDGGSFAHYVDGADVIAVNIDETGWMISETDPDRFSVRVGGSFSRLYFSEADNMGLIIHCTREFSPQEIGTLKNLVRFAEKVILVLYDGHKDFGRKLQADLAGVYSGDDFLTIGTTTLEV